MTTSSNLNIEHLVSNASSPEVPVNEAYDLIDSCVADQITKNFASDADLTLSTSGAAPQEWQYLSLKLTDTGVVLTTARNVIVPTNKKTYLVFNGTAQILTVKTSAGTGIAIPSSGTHLLYCDGTNVGSVESVPSDGSGNIAPSGIYLGGTAAANLLDDYEGEGTWTPVVKGSSTAGTYTYTVRQATYTKTGNVVYYNFDLRVNAVTVAGTGNLIVDGVPFAAVTTSSGNMGPFPAYHFGSAWTYEQGIQVVVGSEVSFLSLSAAGQQDVTDVSVIGAGDYLRGAGFFYVS